MTAFRFPTVARWRSWSATSPGPSSPIAIALLRRRVRLAIPFVWLLAAETAYDTVTNIHGGIQEHLMGAASGVTWLILVFFVPMVVVSGVLMIWQLYSRRNEGLGSDRERDTHPAGAPLRRAF
jgi:hypothetical protein